MVKYKKYFGIIIFTVLILVLFVNYVVNLDSNQSASLMTTEDYEEGSDEVPENTEEVIIIVDEAEIKPIPNASSNVISVKDFGAKGDGITDDSKAFQKAIHVASENNIKLLIPESSDVYLILNSLELKSNTHIIGYDAAIFMPSHRQVQNIFYASSNREVSNITIEGLTLLSENDQEGKGEYEGSLTSNVQGIYLLGIKNFIINDVQMDSMYIGIKLGSSKDGDKSENININNLEIYNSRTPLFITSTTQFKMTDSILDASGGATKFLHSAYIRGDTSDIEFDHVQFINSPGGGIHIYNSNKDMAAPENIRVTDSYIENTKVGFYIYSGAKDIYIANIIMKNVELPFKINSAVGVNIEKVEISSNPEINKPVGLFNMIKISDSNITQVTLDGVGMTGYLFDLGSEVTDLTISELRVTHLSNVGLLYGTSESIQNLVIENSRIEWTSLKGPLMRFRSAGSYAIIRDNHFINHGKKADLEVFNTTNTNVILENNDYTGF